MDTTYYYNVLNSSQIADNHSLDHPERKKWLKSRWQAFIHRDEKRQDDQKILLSVREYFQQKYQLSDKAVFDRLWRELGAKIWTPKVPLNAGTLRTIDLAFKERLFYSGKGVCPPDLSDSRLEKPILEVTQTIFHGGPLSMEILKKRLLRAVLLKKDEHFLRQFRLEIQMELDNLSSHLPSNEKEEAVWRAFLGNVLAVLPFSYPSSNDTFTIPILEQGVCRKVEYNLEVIPLTGTKWSSAITAVGLTPKIDKKAPPILSFLGTTYPGGDGFAATVLTDFMPGYSVGSTAYKTGAKQIDQWMIGKKEVHLIGASLGGALVFHTLRDHHNKLSRVDVYNPPGLKSEEWHQEYHEGCPIHIYNQAGDLVSQVGFFPQGSKVQLYQVLPHHEGVREEPLGSHSRAYTGCKKVSLLLKEPKIENKTFLRRVMTLTRQIVGPLITLSVWLGLFVYGVMRFCAFLLRYCSRAFEKCLSSHPNLSQ